MFKKAFRFVLWILALLLLFQFASTVWAFFSYRQSAGIAYVRDDSRAESVAGIVCGRNDGLTAQFADMAAFSAEVYLDKNLNLAGDLSAAWEKLKPSEADFEAKRLSRQVEGLRYGLWVNRDAQRAIIAFRGTDGFLSLHANLHWLVKWLPFARDQYEEVRHLTPQLVRYLQAQYGADIEIHTTGHSLGGGLAQHALYSNKAITVAYAFNSSPVTGWHDLDEKERATAVRGNRVFRIHENGEVLEFLRLLMKAGYLANPKPNEDPYFKEYRFNFSHGSGLLHQHSIGDLARKLIEIRKGNCPAKDTSASRTLLENS